MKKVDLLFNVKIEGSELIITAFVSSVTDVHPSTQCSVIDKQTLADGTFNISLSGTYNKLPQNMYERVLLEVFNYCKDMYIGDALLATALRHIIEKLYVIKYLSVDEYSNVWLGLLDLCRTLSINILPYKTYGIQSSVDNTMTFTNFVYASVSSLHVPVCIGDVIIGYLESDDNGIYARVINREYVNENILGRLEQAN